MKGKKSTHCFVAMAGECRALPHPKKAFEYPPNLQSKPCIQFLQRARKPHNHIWSSTRIHSPCPSLGQSPHPSPVISSFPSSRTGHLIVAYLFSANRNLLSANRNHCFCLRNTRVVLSSHTHLVRYKCVRINIG